MQLLIFRGACALAAVLLAVVTACAEQLPLHYFTVADGLGSDRINCLLKDSRGFLWFCTDEGVSRYDGYTFTNYTVDDDRHRRAFAMLETADGDYWAGFQGGIGRFEPVARSSTHFTMLAPDRALRAWTANALAEDPRGGLWVGTTNWGLYHVDRDGNRWRLRSVDIGLPHRGSEPATIRALHASRDGTLWVGAGSGLYRRSPDGQVVHFDRRNGLSGVDIRAILEEHDRLWIGSRDGGLCLLTSAEDGSIVVTAKYGPREGLAATHVEAIWRSADGTMWIGGYGGLTRLVVDANGSRRVERAYTMNEGLSATGISALDEDRDGNLWIGTEDAGVMKLARDGFVTYTQRDGLPSLHVNALLEDRTGAVCVVTPATDVAALARHDWFISRFDGQHFHATRPNVPSGTEFGWGWHQIWLQGRHGDWWIPTLRGVYRFSNVGVSELAVERPASIFSTRHGLPDNDVFRLYEDAAGDLWISTLADLQSRLTRWNRASRTFHTFTSSDGMPEDAATAFAEDRRRGLWIGFYEAGLARVRDGRVTTWSVADGIPAGMVRSLHVDAGGSLWIATGSGGVARIDDVSADRPHIVSYTTRNGLPSNDVWTIAEDDWGRIYFGTGNGLARLDVKSGEIRRFTSSDGLAPGIVQVSFRAHGGDLWFGTPQGLSRLIPQRDRPRAPPPTLVTAVRVAGVPMPVSELGVRETPPLDLSSSQDHVDIEFVGLGFGAGEALRYRYKLEGTNDDRWIPIAQRTVSFANLSPGAYRFVVEAIGADGRTSSQPAAVSFTIATPLWRRWWFEAFAILAIAALVYAAHHNRVTRLVAIERVRTRIATDLHDDVGSSLSRMAILSEVLIRQAQSSDPARVRVLTEIADSARALVDGMSDIVWSIDPRRDDLNSLLARLRDFAADVLDARGIPCVFEAPPSAERVRLAADHRRHVYLILKEAVTNIARHARCSRAGIRVAVDGSTLIAEVWDDGQGLTEQPGRPESRSGGHGLHNMKARAREIGARLDIRSTDAGSAIRLSVALT